MSTVAAGDLQTHSFCCNYNCAFFPEQFCQLNMQTIFLLLGILLFILPSSSGVKVTSIAEIPDEINVQEGTRLLIPCRFKTDKSTHNSKIEMEWGQIPFEGGSLKHFVYIYDPELLEYHDSRAHVFLHHLRHGNCSLVIDPVHQEDEGYFELHLGVDKNSYDPYPFLSVRVTTAYGHQNETSDQNRGLLDIKKQTIKDFLAHPNLSKKPIFTSMLIFAAVFLNVSIVGSVGVSTYLVFRQWRKKRQDALRLAEEGYTSLYSINSQTVSETSQLDSPSQLSTVTNVSKDSFESASSEASEA